MQRLVLDLQFARTGPVETKVALFRSRYPNITGTGYALLLLRLLDNPLAYRYRGGAYAPRLAAVDRADLHERVGLSAVGPTA